MRPLTEVEEKKFRTIRLLAAVMLVATPIFYAVVAYTVTPLERSMKGANDMLTYILVIVSLSLPLVMTLVMKVQKAAFRKDTSSKMSLMQFLFTLNIQKFAFAEAVFIFGLVTAFVTGDTSRLWWFYLIGAAFVAYVWPRRQKFEELIEELERP